MIVVDANVLVDFLAGEEKLKMSAQALAFEDPDWISIALWRYELGNALLKLVRRTGKPASGVIGEILRDVDGLLIETVDHVERGEVWEIAVECGLTYYDSAYVWLARSRGMRLRTRDKEVLKRCPEIAVPMPE